MRSIPFGSHVADGGAPSQILVARFRAVGVDELDHLVAVGGELGDGVLPGQELVHEPLLELRRLVEQEPVLDLVDGLVDELCDGEGQQSREHGVGDVLPIGGRRCAGERQIRPDRLSDSHVPRRLAEGDPGSRGDQAAGTALTQPSRQGGVVRAPGSARDLTGRRRQESLCRQHHGLRRCDQFDDIAVDRTGQSVDSARNTSKDLLQHIHALRKGLARCGHTNTFAPASDIPRANGARSSIAWKLPGACSGKSAHGGSPPLRPRTPAARSSLLLDSPSGRADHEAMTDHLSVRAARRRPVLLLAALAAALGVAVPVTAASAVPAHPAPHTVTYRASTADIANPERGFDHETDTHFVDGGKGWAALTDTQLRAWRKLGDTQINRVYYLDDFAKGADLSPALLHRLQHDFDVVKRNGFTEVLRFAYVEGGAGPYVAPFGDAALPTVLKHIRQLTPLLRRSTGLIATLQSGFIGLWGEGYYTDTFADPATQVVSDADWAKRKAVVDAELKAIPTRTVQVRTPLMKQRIVGTTTGTAGALTAAEAFRNTEAARIGHHNDCFLAAEDDWGTYLSDPITLDQDYLAADSRYVPVGGETCNVDPPRSEFANASAQMQRFHYSYLNREYNTDVLDSWGAAGIATAERNLGYRFEMVSSTVQEGRTPTVSIEVKNTGWASPYNARPAELVLVNGKHRFTVPIRTDVRRWAAGTTTTVRTALQHLPAGTYSVSLALPAAQRLTAKDPDYAIRTANIGTWHASSGLNDLHQTVRVR
jgi:hypothetical protein